ncbi:hypothetical protein TNIN_85371 [Trichonephila inaurata madagascariensis]|uniref:Uncharacterized protein n=1 Tax=Trichonephila inaurata madagascariensis TaxID=2747483 RepID=A0A8X7CGG1_9ARAC|nr:hypothetical protein TNIN_85371 [Trichonephila inaurata madagascariensis]
MMIFIFYPRFSPFRWDFPPSRAPSFLKTKTLLLLGNVETDSKPCFDPFCHLAFFYSTRVLGKKGSLGGGCEIALLAEDRVQDVLEDTASSFLSQSLPCLPFISVFPESFPVGLIELPQGVGEKHAIGVA